MKVIRLIIFLLCFSKMTGFGQRSNDICENNVPASWTTTNGDLSVSSKHYKLGRQSLEWNWNAKMADLNIQDTSFSHVANDKRSCFAIWIYNETPVDDSLQFLFGIDGKTSCSFSFQLNYKGWRTAWVMYNRDMKGTAVPGMNRLTISAPASVKKGSLFFDDIVYDATVDPRAPMRDLQVPFINPVRFNTSANAHWVNLLQFSRLPGYLKISKTVTAKQLTDIEKVVSRYEQIIMPSPARQQTQTRSITKAFEQYHIRREGNNITGRPVNSINAYEIDHDVPLAKAKEYAQEYGVQNASNLLLKIAIAYRSHTISPSEKIVLSNQFLDLLDHLHDQGWAYGSGMGSVHHLGYNFRNYFSACLLMRDVLKKNNRLPRTQNDMYWFSGLGRTNQLPGLMPSSNIDVFNTLLGGMLATILVMDNTPQKVQQLQQYTAWLSQNIGPEYSIEGTFKPGGAITHHGTLYPAYAIDGLNGLTPVIYTLSNTSFAVTSKAYDVIKESLMMMHRYTNPLYWPLSVSGRHPGEGKISAEPFAYMALAGGSKPFDTSMAAIYLQIQGASLDSPFSKDFISRGIAPASFPEGHWDMNYGLLGIHRRDNWVLTVRGHNRYFVTHESYPGANMFGRYLTYGNLELFYPNNTINKGSYFKDEGWDWNNIPGTTSLYLPLKQLRANIINADDFSGIEEMLLTDEVFAGGTHLGNQGMYAMKLHGTDKYDMGSFRAIKSWFMFDNLIVCVGSNISNSIKDYPTITTLFQNYLVNQEAPVFSADKTVTAFPFEQKWMSAANLNIIDNRRTGYYLPDAGNVILFKSVQKSRNQQDTRDTEGAFAKLIIDHGKAPVNASYEYAMLISTDSSHMKQFVSNMSSTRPVYLLLQSDSLAHIIYYAPQKITGCALFTKDKETNDSLIINNNRPCLVMYQKEKNSISLSLTDPDLGFYKGPDDTPLLPNGKRKEVSIYSKKWYATPATPSTVQLTLKGIWKLDDLSKNATVSSDKKGNTILQVPCSFGEANNLRLIH